MPRPTKCRKICCLPACSDFGPLTQALDQDCIITMAVDEYETIRLIDLEDLSQEDCAKQMGVARTTVQRIYNSARKKLAQAIVYSKALRIEGGDYDLCQEKGKSCRKGCCRRYPGLKEE